MERKSAQYIHKAGLLEIKKTGFEYEKSQAAFIVQVARKTVLTPNTQNHALVTTKFSGLVLIKPPVLPTTRQLTIAACVIMDISFLLKFYVIVSSDRNQEVCSPKQMKIAQAAEPPNLIHAVDVDNQNTCLTETPEVDINFNRKTANGSYDQQQSDGSAVRYKAPEFRQN